MRDMLMLILVVGWIPMAVMNGFVAFLLWVFANLFSPHAYLYGFMVEFRFVFVFAVLALGALVLGRLKDRAGFVVDGATVLMLFFIAHTLISAALAFSSNPMVSIRLENFVKGMALALVVPFFVNSRWRIHLVILAVVLGLGFHGVVDGLKMIASGGGHMIHGIPNSTLSDNNLYALGIVMLLPLILYIAKYSAYQWARWGALGAFGLCVMTVLGSNSRGGFLAMAILGIWYWLTSSRKLVSTAFIAIVAIGIVQFAPERWFDRIETIKEADQDDSFLGRVAAWKVSVNIANDHPIFGGGFDATQVGSIWNQYKYKPNFINIDISEAISFKAAHSNYFQVLGDSGYVGLLLFLAMMAATFLIRWDIKSIARRLPGDNAWAIDLSTAITLSLVAFMAGGAGVSLAYFELVYLQIMLLAVIRRLMQQQAAQSTQKAPIGGAPAGRVHV